VKLDLSKAFLIISIVSISPISQAQDTKASEPEEDILEVEKIKEKYWAQGEESQLGVVQNRTYSKKEKIQIGLLGGRSMDDPFLSVNLLGGNISYNVSEFWGFSLLGWNYSVSPSNALNVLRAGGKESNSITPKSYIGSEVSGSFLYGKLSLVGAKIIYYDMHFTLGGGATAIEGDSAAMTVSMGLGQRFYLSENMSFRMDYRAQTFQATEYEKEITPKKGQANGIIRHWNHVVGLEINYMFGVK